MFAWDLKIKCDSKMGIKERKEQERKARRQRIQKAAKELFTAKGFKATTMEEIAEKAELSAGTIYQYFKNKEDLYFSFNLEPLKLLHNKAIGIRGNNGLSIEEKIMEFKEGFYETFQRDPLLLRNLLHLQLEGSLLQQSASEELVTELNYLFKEITTIIADVYLEGVRKGIFREGHGMAHADMIWGIFTGIMVVEEAKRGIDPRKDFFRPTLDRAFDIFMRGIKKGGRIQT